MYDHLVREHVRRWWMPALVPGGGPVGIGWVEKFVRIRCLPVLNSADTGGSQVVAIEVLQLLPATSDEQCLHQPPRAEIN